MPRPPCDHFEFRAVVNVARIEGSALKYADITVSCAACGAPALFRGMSFGLSPDAACKSIDAKEARLPFVCEGDAYDGEQQGFIITGKLS